MKKIKVRSEMRGQRDRGSYLVLAAFVLVVLMLASGLAVDVSRKFSLEQNCQDIADAAAMAGANMLPDAARARLTCSTYIQSIMSASNGQYVLDDSAIQIRVDTATQSCTIGVIVAGTWDPVLLPTWLLGDERYQTSRYSIAVMSWTTTGGGSSGATIDERGLDTMAFFIGDTYSVTNNPQCGGSYTANVNGNNFTVNGATQINHDFHANGTADFNSTVNIVGNNTTTDAGINFNAGVNTSAPVVAMPKLDESKMNMDVTLDWNDPDVAAYYTQGVAKAIKAKGPDNDLGTADDIAIEASNSSCNAGDDVTATYNGLDAYGHQLWTISSGLNKRINSACFAVGGNLGLGLDIKINGDVIMNNLDGMDGFIWTTGSLTLNSNMNADFNMTADNPGLCIYTGPPGDLTKESLLVNANLSQESFIGLLYVDGNVKFDGNGSNNENTIRGGLWAKRMDPDCAGTMNGNNWGITGDPTAIGDVPLMPNATLPVKYAAPTVWLAK